MTSTPVLSGPATAHDVPAMQGPAQPEQVPKVVWAKPKRRWWQHESASVRMSYTASFWDFHGRYVDSIKKIGGRV